MGEEFVTSLVYIAEEFVHSGTKFSNAYKNSEGKIKKARPKAPTLVAMKAAYNKFLTAYTDQESVEEFFKGKNKVLHLKILMLLRNKLFE